MDVPVNDDVKRDRNFNVLLIATHDEVDGHEGEEVGRMTEHMF